jgi:hypothetical protein
MSTAETDTDSPLASSVLFRTPAYWSYSGVGGAFSVAMIEAGSGVAATDPFSSRRVVSHQTWRSAEWSARTLTFAGLIR